MQKCKNILRIFFGMAILFTIVFQSVHSILHISEHRIISEVKSDFYLQKRDADSHKSFEWTAHNEIEKCHTCSFFFSPFVSSEITLFNNLETENVSDVQDLIVNKVSALNQVYVSLRAPPVYI